MHQQRKSMEHEQETEYSESDYRACAIMFLGIVQPAIAHVMAAQSQKIGYCQILFALGLNEKSMRDAAAELSVNVSCISTGAKRFIKENGLPIPPCMKSAKASKTYSKSKKERMTA